MEARMTLLRCATCRQELPTEEFHSSRNLKRGYAYSCKSCRCNAGLNDDQKNEKLLRQQGLRTCTVCREVKIYLLDFYHWRTVCRPCHIKLLASRRPVRGRRGPVV